MANATMIGVIGQIACYNGGEVRYADVAASPTAVRSVAG